MIWDVVYMITFFEWLGIFTSGIFAGMLGRRIKNWIKEKRENNSVILCAESAKMLSESSTDIVKSFEKLDRQISRVVYKQCKHGGYMIAKLFYWDYQVKGLYCEDIYDHIVKDLGYELKTLYGNHYEREKVIKELRDANAVIVEWGSSNKYPSLCKVLEYEEG